MLTNLNLPEVWAKRYQEKAPLPLDLSRTILKYSLSVRPQKPTAMLAITVLSPRPAEAAGIANAMTRIYLASPLAPRTSGGEPAAKIVEPAVPAQRPSRPNKLLNILTGCGMGAALAGLGFVLLIVRRKSPAA